MYYAYVQSPIGPLLLAGRNAKLELLAFPRSNQARAHKVWAMSRGFSELHGNPARVPAADWVLKEAAFVDAIDQLDEYFCKKRRVFDLLLAPPAPNSFQQPVRKALQAIPYGETRSYREVAKEIPTKTGRPTAARAVGGAMADNPIPIIIPCHRVIGSDGTLTGYGGGLDAKRYLLNLEGDTEVAA